MSISFKVKTTNKYFRGIFAVLLLALYVTSLLIVTITASEDDSRWAEILPAIFGAITFFITLYVINFVRVFLKHRSTGAYIERQVNKRLTIGGNLASMDKSFDDDDDKIRKEVARFSLARYYHFKLWYSYSRLTLTCMMRNSGIVLLIWDVIRLFVWLVTITYWRRDNIDIGWRFNLVPPWLYPIHFFVISASTAEMLLFILETQEFKDIISSPVFWINSLLLPPLVIIMKLIFFKDLTYMQVYWFHGFLIWIKIFVWTNTILKASNDGRDKAKHIIKIVLEIFVMSCCFAGSMYMMQGIHPDANVNQFNYALEQYADLFYFAIITISTVGYGDMKPLTLGARFSALFFISWVLIWIPITINHTIQMLHGQCKISGHLLSWASIKKFVLLIGDVDPFQLSQFISKVYYSSEDIKIILITPNEIEMYSCQIDQASTLGVQICLLNGDVDLNGNINILEDVKARVAMSVFVLSSFKGKDPRTNDMKTIIRAISAKKYGCSTDNIIMQFCSPIGHDFITKTIGINVNLHLLKMSMITKNILCPGIITLIVNLTLNQNYSIAQRYPQSLNKSLRLYHWYLRGASKRLCIHSIPNVFHGCTFEVCSHINTMNCPLYVHYT